MTLGEAPQDPDPSLGLVWERAPNGHEALARAKNLGPLLTRFADQAERQCNQSLEVIAALRDAGLFGMWVPLEFGGSELDLVENQRVVEAIARYDASAAWCLMIATGTSLYAVSCLDPVAARAIYGGGRTMTVGFVLPQGRAERTTGGYRVSGRWPFGSGAARARWLLSGTTLSEAGGRWLTVALPAHECQLVGNWNTLGLRGSGSGDYLAENVFVPEEHGFFIQDAPLRQDGAAYRFRGSYLANLGAVPLGAAQAALDWVAAQQCAPATVARAEALVGSARCYLHETCQDLFETVLSGSGLSLQQRSRFRIALFNAFDAALNAVGLLHDALATKAIHSDSAIDKAFRDLHTMKSHAAINGRVLEVVGGMLGGKAPPEGWLF